MHYRYLLAVAALALAGCQDPSSSIAPSRNAPVSANSSHQHGVLAHSGAQLPSADLARVRAATARYAVVDNAINDGYHDIGVIIPNMGRHFLRDSLVDARFDAEHPELLVYSSDTNGHMNLVSVEYAIPLSLSATAPEGFAGDADEWFADQHFQLWTLHAWVWRENPLGMFNPTNSRVP